jgi:hypothetical protein
VIAVFSSLALPSILLSGDACGRALKAAGQVIDLRDFPLDWREAE